MIFLLIVLFNLNILKAADINLCLDTYKDCINKILTEPEQGYNSTLSEQCTINYN